MKRSLCTLLTALTLCLALCVSAGAAPADDAAPAPQPPTDVEYHIVTFDADGGEPAPGSPQLVPHGGTVPCPVEPAKEGYRFYGWTYRVSDDTHIIRIWNFNTPVTDDLALTAQWSANVYEITYALNGGTNHQDNREWYVYGMGVSELLPPTRSGYIFDGWYLTEDFSTDALTGISAETMGDITLYAKWTRRHYSTITSGTLSRGDGSKLADENGAVSAEPTVRDGRVTGFTVDGKSLDSIDLKDLNLRLAWKETELSLSPKAIRQLLDANAGSLTLDMPGADMTIPQEMLRGVQQQLNGKDLDISLVSGKDAIDGLSPAQRSWMPIMREFGKFLPISALTGEFSVGGEPLDWSEISGVLDISLTLEMPKSEKKSGWHKENGQWFYYEDSDKPMEPEFLPPLEDRKYLEIGYMVEDENGDWVMKGLEPPTILPLPDLREETYNAEWKQDWDLPRSEDIAPEFKWTDDKLLLDFELPHFSTYLIVTRIAMPFDDVAEGAWYYDAVKWTADEGLTGGTDNTHFSPDAACTRAQFVTFLWRLAGKPVVNYLVPFTDVPESAWYAEAVRWAASEKIVEGITAAAFEPNATVSRAQAVTMLWRYAKHSGADASVGEDTNILSYDDAFDVPAWAIEAVQWACGAQVLRGSGEKLMPNDPCTRAQAVAMMTRYVG